MKFRVEFEIVIWGQRDTLPGESFFVEVDTETEAYVAANRRLEKRWSYAWITSISPHPIAPYHIGGCV